MVETSFHIRARQKGEYITDMDLMLKFRKGINNTSRAFNVLPKREKHEGPGVISHIMMMNLVR